MSSCAKCCDGSGVICRECLFKAAGIEEEHAPKILSPEELDRLEADFKTINDFFGTDCQDGMDRLIATVRAAWAERDHLVHITGLVDKDDRAYMVGHRDGMAIGRATKRTNLNDKED